MYHSSDEGCIDSNETKRSITAISSNNSDGFHKKTEHDGHNSDDDGDDNLATGATKHPTKNKNGFQEIRGEADGEGDDKVCHRDYPLRPLPQESLMAEKHIRVILVMQGLYSVRHSSYKTTARQN